MPLCAFNQGQEFPFIFEDMGFRSTNVLTKKYIFLGEWKKNVLYCRSLHMGIRVPYLMYGCKTRVYTGQDRSILRAVEMENLCSIMGIMKIDVVTNEDVRMIGGVKNH